MDNATFLLKSIFILAMLSLAGGLAGLIVSFLACTLVGKC